MLQKYDSELANLRFTYLNGPKVDQTLRTVIKVRLNNT